MDMVVCKLWPCGLILVCQVHHWVWEYWQKCGCCLEKWSSWNQTNRTGGCGPAVQLNSVEANNWNVFSNHIHNICQFHHNMSTLLPSIHCNFQMLECVEHSFRSFQDLDFYLQALSVYKGGRLKNTLLCETTGGLQSWDFLVLLDWANLQPISTFVARSNIQCVL